MIAGGRPGAPRFEPVAEEEEDNVEGSDDDYASDWFVQSLRPPSNELETILSIVGGYGPESRTPISWDGAEQRLQVRLPTDYKQCIDALGAGSFRDLHVAAPNWPVADFDLFNLISRLNREPGASSFRFGSRPENSRGALEGLIPWGWTGDGLIFFWRAAETPGDEWLIFLAQPDLIGFRLMSAERQKLSTTGVIARYLQDPLSIVERLADSRTQTLVDPRIPPDLPPFSPAL